MKRYYVIFTGQVQGVGFRYTISALASKLNITGWVRNRYDGAVECELQGEDEVIMDLISRLHHASRWISIDDYVIKAIPVEDHEYGFKVEY